MSSAARPPTQRRNRRSRRRTQIKVCQEPPHRLVLSELCESNGSLHSACGSGRDDSMKRRFAPSVGMTDWRTSVGLKGRWNEKRVIPSEANGRVEEPVGNPAGRAIKPQVPSLGWVGGRSICVYLRDLRFLRGWVGGRPPDVRTPTSRQSDRDRWRDRWAGTRH